MKKKFTVIMILVLVMSLMLCACGDSKKPDASASDISASDAPKTDDSKTDTPVDVSANLTMGTGGDTGTYFAFGGVLSQYVSSNTGVKITAVASGGSQANIEDIDAGEVQLGTVQSDVMTYAYTGTNLFAEPITSFSTLGALYMEQVQIVTLDPSITSVADLAGKIVSIGAAGSGVYYNAIDVLGVYGLTESDIKPVYQSFGDSVESLQDGKIDAAFIVAGVPTNAVSSLATTNDVYLVGLDEQHVADLISLSPYYSAYTVPADVYGTPTDVNTVAVAAVLIVSNDVSDDVVYTITSTIYDNIPAITEQHAKGGELSLEFGSSITSVPYHPGAAKYFAEKGFNVG